MKLRSGFETSGLCVNCCKFYGNRKWDFKCSTCTNKFVTVSNNRWISDSLFRKEVNKWALEKSEYTRKKKIVRILKHAICTTCFTNKESVISLKILILQIKKNFQENNERLYITSNEGKELLRNSGRDCIEKSHIICPLVIDWWNMKELNYNSSELCYYGRYGEPEYHIKSIPPPLPLSPY